MIAKGSVGVAISRSRLTIVFAKASPFRTQIRACATHELDPAASVPERTAAVCALVQSFWRQHRIGDACIWIGLPADVVIQRVIALPSAARENLDKAIEYELQKYIPRELEHFHFQYQVLHEDRAERRLHILVSAVKKGDLGPIIEARDNFSAGIFGVESAATAAINGLRWATGPLREKTYGLGYAAEGTMHLAYFEDGEPRHVWALDLGDDVAPQRQQLLQRLEALGAGPGATLRVYCHGPAATEDVLRAWNGAPNLEFRRLELPEDFPEGDNAIVGAGLAVKGLHQVALDINLFPEPFRKRPSVLGRYVGGALAALALVGGVAWAASQFLHPRVLDRRVERELSELAGEVEALRQLQAQAQELRGQIEYLDGLRRERMDALGFLKELTEVLPDTSWLLSLSVAGDKAAIQGIAESSTELIPQLEASPLFGNAQFTATITKGREGQDVFKIGFDIDR
jgi:Tfp pilus assembly protein PilN